MKKMLAIVIASLFTPMLASGVNGDIPFNAERDCQDYNTQTGIRYVPPCEFTPVTLIPQQNTVVDISSFILDGQFKSTLHYYFQCESLRPLSISYALKENNISAVTGLVAGSVSKTLLVNSLTHSYNAASMVVEALNGSNGIQAIKPGCKMEIESFVSYPDPGYFTLLVNSQISINNLLKTIFSIAQPGVDYVTALSALENSQILLSFLRTQSDAITQGMIDIMLTRLMDAKNILAKDCEVGSGSTLCSEAIANTRSALAGEIVINEEILVELHSYLQMQVVWLEITVGKLSVETERMQQSIDALEQQLSTSA